MLGLYFTFALSSFPRPDSLPQKLFYTTTNDKLDSNLGTKDRESRFLSVFGKFADFLQLLPGLFLDEHLRQQHFSAEWHEGRMNLD